MHQPVFRSRKVGDADVFYREAGPDDGPTVLLHGFPTASHMFRGLPDAEVHLLDTGHFALETHHREVAALMRGFLARHVA